jgi:sugar phosphate isomerase/epimerase
MLRRRDLLAAAAAAGVGAASGVTRAADRGRRAGRVKTVRLRLSAQERIIPGATLGEKLDKMEAWGFEGLEPSGKELPENVERYQKALAGRKVRISAVCAGFKGSVIAADSAERKKTMGEIKRILEAAGALGAVGLVMVPSFNRHKRWPHKMARERLTGFLRWDEPREWKVTPILVELAEHAHKHGTRIILEPLNRQECYFLRVLADAASMCKDVNHPACVMMGDFWHMTWEETSDYAAFMSGGKYLQHVHMASRKRRKTPGEDGDADNYVDGFRALKELAYPHFVSFECGAIGDPNVVVPAAAKLLREQWTQA